MKWSWWPHLPVLLVLFFILTLPCNYLVIHCLFSSFVVVPNGYFTITFLIITTGPLGSHIWHFGTFQASYIMLNSGVFGSFVNLYIYHCVYFYTAATNLWHWVSLWTTENFRHLMYIILYFLEILLCIFLNI